MRNVVTYEEMKANPGVYEAIDVVFVRGDGKIVLMPLYRKLRTSDASDAEVCLAEHPGDSEGW